MYLLIPQYGCLTPLLVSTDFGTCSYQCFLSSCTPVSLHMLKCSWAHTLSCLFVYCSFASKGHADIMWSIVSSDCWQIIIIIIIIIIITILVITFMQAIYNYIPETRNVSRVRNVAAVLYLQSVVHVRLFSPCILHQHFPQYVCSAQYGWFL